MTQKEKGKKQNAGLFSPWLAQSGETIENFALASRSISSRRDGPVKDVKMSGGGRDMERDKTSQDRIGDDQINADEISTRDGFINYLKRFDFYDLLQIEQDASGEQIHKSYLRRVRNLLISSELEQELKLWQIELLVHFISLAHETLRDPLSRASYNKGREFRQISGNQQSSSITNRGRESSKVHSLLSLLRYSQFVSGSDLNAAVAANEGKTELQIAAYLVEVGKLTLEDLESITLARYLLALGKISITQYEYIVSEMKDTGVPFWVGLVAKGWVQMSDVIS